MERERWQELADHLNAEMARRGWYQRDLADHAGVSLRTVSRLINRQYTRLPRTIARVEQAVGWSPGDARRVVYEGYRPEIGEQPPHPWVEQKIHELRKVLTPAELQAMREYLERAVQDPEVHQRAMVDLIESNPEDQPESVRQIWRTTVRQSSAGEAKVYLRGDEDTQTA